MYERAVVALPDNDAKAVQTYLTRRGTNDRGDLVVLEEGPEFPVSNAKVVFNGNTAVVSVPVAGRRARRVLRLTEANLVAPKRDGDPITISGIVDELLLGGLTPEDATTTLTIQSYSVCTTC